jgi:hypothetical protein
MTTRPFIFPVPVMQRKRKMVAVAVVAEKRVAKQRVAKQRVAKQRVAEKRVAKQRVAKRKKMTAKEVKKEPTKMFSKTSTVSGNCSKTPTRPAR